jgi:hypothetical protein
MFTSSPLIDLIAGQLLGAWKGARVTIVAVSAAPDQPSDRTAAGGRAAPAIAVCVHPQPRRCLVGQTVAVVVLSIALLFGPRVSLRLLIIAVLG